VAQYETTWFRAGLSGGCANRVRDLRNHLRRYVSVISVNSLSRPSKPSSVRPNSPPCFFRKSSKNFQRNGWYRIGGNTLTSSHNANKNIVACLPPSNLALRLSNSMRSSLFPLLQQKSQREPQIIQDKERAQNCGQDGDSGWQCKTNHSKPFARL
jgi:hypothetical protein